jgi:hypothetical protein
MKKIACVVLFGLLLLAIVPQIYAQAAPATTLSPASFTAQDQVTITADVTGTPMAGITPAIIWIWCYPTVGAQDSDANAITAPVVDAGGSWAGVTSNPGPAMMTHVSGNIWTFTFTGTTLFGLTPGGMYSFDYLVRSADGNTQTGNALIKGSGYKFVPLVFTPTELRVFPAAVDTSDVVALNFDQSLATALNDQRMTPDSVRITAYDDESTPVQIGNPLTIPAVNTSGTIWTAVFIPSANFAPVSNGHKLASFTYHFSGTLLDINGDPTTVSTVESASFNFTPMK